MKHWRPVPEKRRFRARLLDGSLIEYEQLRVGDVFQTIHPDGITVLHPIEETPDEEVYARCVNLPVQNVGQYGPVREGWCVPVEIGSRDEITKALS